MKSDKFSGLNGFSSPTGTSIRNIPADEQFFIRIKTVSTVNGRPVYSWERVNRSATGAWENTGQTGGNGYDAAYELNDQTAPLNQVYRAFRSPDCGQVLFF